MMVGPYFMFVRGGVGSGVGKVVGDPIRFTYVFQERNGTQVKTLNERSGLSFNIFCNILPNYE